MSPRKKKEAKKDFFTKPGDDPVEASDEFVAAHREPWEAADDDDDLNESYALAREIAAEQQERAAGGKKVMLSVQVPADLRRQLKIMAVAREKKMGELIRNILEDAIAQDDTAVL